MSTCPNMYTCTLYNLIGFGGGGRVEGSGTESTVTEVITWPNVQAPDEDECGAIRRMICKRGRNTRRKPVSVPLCLLQIPHDLTRARTLAAAIGSRRPELWHSLCHRLTRTFNILLERHFLFVQNRSRYIAPNYILRIDFPKGFQIFGRAQIAKTLRLL
jgi:hypothetical protein